MGGHGLLRACRAFWELEESSGSRADRHGGQSLTEHNTVTSSGGRVGQAASFEESASEYLSRASEAAIQAGDVAYTWLAWAMLESRPGHEMVLVGKVDTGNGQSEYRLATGGSANNPFVFRVYRPTDSAVDVETGGGIAIGTWYFLEAAHDPIADEITIGVNGATPAGQSTGGALQSPSNADLTLGRTMAQANVYYDGLLDQVVLLRRVLTARDRAAWYNRGYGRSYKSCRRPHRHRVVA